MNKTAHSLKSALIFWLMILLAWEFLIRSSMVSAFLLPSPTMVGQALYEHADVLVVAIFETLSSALLGFLLSLFFGVLIGFAQVLAPLLRSALGPIAVFFQTVPIVAIAPLLVVWFGFGQQTVIVSAFIVSFFPILANFMLGLDQYDKNLEELFKLYHSSQKSVLWRLRFPSSLGYLYSGAKISLGLAVIGTIVGEFIAGGGLGALIDSARTQQKIDLVFAAVISSAFMGLMLMQFLRLAAFLFIRRRPYFQI